MIRPKPIWRGMAAILAAGVIGWAGAAVAQTAEIVIGAPNAMSGGYGEGGRQVIAGLQIAEYL